MATDGVVFCPVAAFPESVVFAVAAFRAPDLKVTVSATNRLCVLGERENNVHFGGSSVRKFCSLAELTACGAVTGAVRVGNVDQVAQCFLAFNGENVLRHWNSFARPVRVIGYIRTIPKNKDKSNLYSKKTKNYTFCPRSPDDLPYLTDADV